MTKEALTQTDQEPIAWAHYQTFDEIDTLQISRFKAILAKKQTGVCSIPLYTTPPQRIWVGLTDEDYFAVLEKLQNLYHHPPIAIFAKAIEQTLKEKNT